MKDLNRLLEEPSTDPLQVSLLRLARSEGPSGESRRRILAGLGMGLAAGTLSQSSSAAQATASSAASSAALNWGLAGVVAIGVSVVAFVGLRQPAPLPALVPMTVPAHTSAVAPAATSIDSTELVPVTRVEDLPTLAGAVPGDPSKTASPPSLAEEVAAIKSAKGALASGNPTQSLHEIDAYRARFPRGRLAQEATVVRIEALLKSGNQAAANAAADRFLAANADSPYAARVHTLIGR